MSKILKFYENFEISLTFWKFDHFEILEILKFLKNYEILKFLKNFEL
jgi:hypothetical protein